MPKELKACRVGPLEIFKEEENRAGRGELGEEPADVGEERGLIRDWLEPSSGERSRGRRQMAAVLTSVEQFAPRAVRRRVRQVEARAFQHPNAPCHGRNGQIAGESRLADARLTTEEHEPASPAKNGGELFAKEDLLQRPADKDGRRAPGVNADSTVGAAHFRSDAVHRCPIGAAGCLRIVQIHLTDRIKPVSNPIWLLHHRIHCSQQMAMRQLPYARLSP